MVTGARILRIYEGKETGDKDRSSVPMPPKEMLHHRERVWSLFDGRAYCIVTILLTGTKTENVFDGYMKEHTYIRDT